MEKEFYRPDLLPVEDFSIWQGLDAFPYAQIIRAQAQEQKKQQRYGWLFIILGVLVLAAAAYILWQKGIFKFK